METEWNCGVCTFVNDPLNAVCGACGAAKPIPNQGVEMTPIPGILTDGGGTSAFGDFTVA